MSAIATPPTTAVPLTPPPGGGARAWKWTREDYYKLGELGFFQGKRVELIRGEIVEMSPINWPHAYATNLVMQALGRAFASGFWVCVQQPFSIPGIAPGSEPQPDVTCVPGTLRGNTGHPTVAALIVEVADTTLFYDTTTKAELYATAGVAEYWVLDLNGRQLHVFRDPVTLPAGLGATSYNSHQILDTTDSVSPLAVPTSRIRVADLLP